MKLEFSWQIFRKKILKYVIFMKNRPVRAELFHAGGRADGQTDMTKLIVVFLNFANSLKIFNSSP